jgi:hypothetical protein
MCINRRTSVQSLRYTCKASYFASKEHAIDENVAWNHDERRELALNFWFYIFIINVIIIKIILDLTSFRRRFMRETIENLKRKILDENKNFCLCAHLFFCASSTRRSLDVVERRNCHHSLFSSCVLIIRSRITRQITLVISSSAKTELKNLFSWISLSSSWLSWRWSWVVENLSYSLL